MHKHHGRISQVLPGKQGMIWFTYTNIVVFIWLNQHLLCTLRFVYLCFEAYMQLRRYSGLFLTLLSLMMQSNLPELSERADIDEVRNALAIEKSDGEATMYFLSQFDDAYGGSWTTQFDWFLHEFNMLLKKGTTS